jgi:alcohol dehydrogenase (cytochrome c)
VGALVRHRPDDLDDLLRLAQPLFIGQLDANMVALDIKTGKEVWRTPVEDWHNGYGITNAPLYFDGIVYSGITGGEFGICGRLTALDAKTGKILWRAYTLLSPAA